ncbi:class I SAM-dependent methyltransferase [Roseovarius nitratireducens]|uniref:class I SAM-dependent methyltransferase n=1 Tax=Roseovarius nitratireducens TaxID=2044597 RepID=UPI000CE19485|nr:class I SAM-dependent methyltransferase [Roseovarius nitratireducens]
MRWLAGLPRQRRVIVECGAGEAEISGFMSKHFNLAIATDPKPPKSAYPAPAASPVGYVKCSAENLPLPSDSVDMVVSMQALHHFDVVPHLAEAHRVLDAGGIFAALAWGEIELPEDVRGACTDFFSLIDHFWEPERGWVVSGYAGLAFRGEKVELPCAALCRTVSVEDLIGVFRGWSACKAGQRECPGPLETALASLRMLRCSGIRISWPIVGQVFRKTRNPSKISNSNRQT